MSYNYEPFDNAQEVWFWFCQSMESQQEGWRDKNRVSGIVRCCEINDIYKIVKRMHQKSGITNRHFRVMTSWGKLGNPPYYDKRAKRSEVCLWEEGMKVFEIYLKEKGIL